MLRVGVVGVGVMGYNHVRVYSELAKEEEIKIIGIVDTNEKRVKEVAKSFNVPYFTNYKDLLNENPDAVSIVVPTFLHKDIALDFIENKVNVLIEKPIADTIENAKEIIKSANKNNVILTVGHIERFNPSVQRLKEIINDGELGEIVTMNAKRVGPMVGRISDVGVIIDLAVHDIDIMRYLTNSKVKEVYARARNVKHPANVEDFALILMNFENEVSGIIETNRLTPHKTRTLNVVGTEGIAYLDYINQTLTLYNDNWIKKAKIDKKEPLKEELRHFIRCIKENKKPLVSGEDGLHALEVSVSALESAKKNKVIKVNSEK